MPAQFHLQFRYPQYRRLVCTLQSRDSHLNMFYVPKPTDAVQEEEFIDGSVSVENNAIPMETNKFRPACLNIKG